MCIFLFLDSLRYLFHFCAHILIFRFFEIFVSPYWWEAAEKVRPSISLLLTCDQRPGSQRKHWFVFLFLFVLCFHFLFWFVSCFIFPVFSCPDHCFDLFLFYLFCFLLSRPPLTWEPTNTLGKERKHWWYFSADLTFPALRNTFLLFISREQ